MGNLALIHQILGTNLRGKLVMMAYLVAGGRMALGPYFLC